MDNVLETVKNIFAMGIKANPGYRLGEAFNMTLDTARDINSLPTTKTERDDDKE